MARLRYMYYRVITLIICVMCPHHHPPIPSFPIICNESRGPYVGVNSIRVIFPNFPVLKQLFDLFERLPTISPFHKLTNDNLPHFRQGCEFSSFRRFTLFFPLRKHAYSNILKISPSKTENFQKKSTTKKTLIFFIFLLKI